ncbi:MAG: 5-formyltetrahydrofolate cyclo-ligase [Gammaproteobacteria bacterium]|nr:5-formyltetrahydrofolate cyclo-ligase [Gammaproteobacteria bacterium]
MRRQRRALTSEERSRAADRLTVSLGKLNVFSAARRVAIFAAIDGEIDLSVAVQHYKNKNYFLPVLPTPGKRRMQFAEVRPRASFKRNRYGILEPDVPAAFLVSAKELDSILAPLVAFDRRGGRIGMGGGFYDATLDFLATRSCWHHPKLVGVAFSFQEVPHIDREPWDIPLSCVVTEGDTIRIS